MMDARGGRPLLLVDLAVPRDIDPACAARGRRDAAGHGRAAGAVRGHLSVRRAEARARRGDRRGRDPDVRGLARAAGGPADADGAARARRRGGRGLLAENAGRWESLSRARSRRASRRSRARSSSACCTSRPQRVRDARRRAPSRAAAAAARAVRPRRGGGVRGRTRPPRSAGCPGDARSGWAPGAARWRWPRLARSRALLGGDVELVDDHHRRRRRPRARRQVALGRRAGGRAAGGRDRPRRALGQGRAGRARAGHRDRRRRRGGPSRSTCCRRGAGRGARGRAGRDERAAPPLPAARRAAGPGGRRAARQRGHAAGQARGGRGRRAGARRRRARPPRAPRRGGSSSDDGVFVPARRPGRDRGPGPAAGARGRCRASTTPPRTRRWTPSAHVVRALEATCHTPVGVLSLDGRVCARSSACPTARPGSRRGGRRADELIAAPARRRRARAAARGGVGVTVFLVGAGPGDPGLMTVRARELIDAADVILYDRLIPPGALDGARADAELVYVGKIGGGPQMPQEEIDRLLVQYGTGARTVVRLKGGDPFVFGRGGEEALVLREAGIPFEVVPGDHRGHRRARLRGHPGHAPRASPAASRSSPATRTGRLDWERAGARSRGRSSSTWASRRCRGSLAAGRGRAARRRAGRGRRARDAAGPEDRRVDARRRSATDAAGIRAPGDHARRAGRRRCASRSRGSRRDRCSGAPSP